ncbi:MAG: hypothetical protein R3E48_10395 [Burkholderiaceae bacterium]
MTAPAISMQAALPVPIKTTKAVEELRKRRYGLTPRLRQLLIMVDGQRDVSELARFFPGTELADGLATLLREGFVSDRRRLRAASATAVAGPLCERVSQRLIEAIGPDDAEVFVQRLGTCTTRAELTDLMPSILAIVELLRGSEAAARFAAEVFDI